MLPSFLEGCSVAALEVWRVSGRARSKGYDKRTIGMLNLYGSHMSIDSIQDPMGTARTSVVMAIIPSRKKIVVLLMHSKLALFDDLRRLTWSPQEPHRQR